MGLIDSLRAWLGSKQRRANALCPPEADILKYKENHLPTKTRSVLELHFANCQDCRELLVLLARFPEAEIAELPPLSSAEIQQQTARVIRLFEENEGGKVAASNRPSRWWHRQGWAYRHRAQFAAMAVMVCALVIGVTYLIASRESASEAARQSLA